MHDDDMSDEFVPDSVRIHQLEQEIAALRARMDLLEKQLREANITQLRIDTAVLEERVNTIITRDATTRDAVRRLIVLTMFVLCLTAANLGLTLAAK